MNRGRGLLKFAAIMAGVVFLQELVLWLYQFGFEVASGDSFAPPAPEYFVLSLPGFIISTLVLAVGFGGGAFVSLRWIAPVSSAISWRQAVFRALLASVFGALGVLALRIAQGLLAAIHIGPHPLGYAFTVSANGDSAWMEVLSALGAALNPFVYNLPLTVLACFVLKLRLDHVPIVKPLFGGATDRASVAAKL